MRAFLASCSLAVVLGAQPSDSWLSAYRDILSQPEIESADLSLMLATGDFFSLSDNSTASRLAFREALNTMRRLAPEDLTPSLCEVVSSILQQRGIELERATDIRTKVLHDGFTLLVPKTPNTTLEGAAIAPDGKRVACFKSTGPYRNTLLLGSTTSKQFRTVDLSETELTWTHTLKVHLSNSERFIICQRYGQCSVRSLRNPDVELRVIPAGNTTKEAWITISPNGQYLIRHYDSSPTEIFDLDAGGPAYPVDLEPPLLISPNSQSIMAYSNAGHLVVHLLRDGTAARKIHTDPLDLLFYINDREILVCKDRQSRQRRIGIFDLKTLQGLWTHEISAANLSRATELKDRNLILVWNSSEILVMTREDPPRVSMLPLIPGLAAIAGKRALAIRPEGLGVYDLNHHLQVEGSE